MNAQAKQPSSNVHATRSNDIETTRASDKRKLSFRVIQSIKRLPIYRSWKACQAFVSRRLGLKPFEEPPYTTQLRYIFWRTRWHILLLLIPAGFAVNYANVRDEVVFAINIAAMVPSITCLSYSLDNLVAHLGDAPAAFLSSTFSNVATLVSSILILRTGDTALTQTSLMGAALSNVLFMPGLCFITGGLRRVEQHLNLNHVKVVGGQLLLAVFGISLVTAFRAFSAEDTGILPTSRAAAVIFILVYVALIFFQWINSDFLPSEKEPDISLFFAACSLALFTTLLTFNTSSAMEQLPAILNVVSAEFLGLILVPVLSNDPTLIMIAIKDEQDLVLRLTLGKTVQLLLVVLPVLILADWGSHISDSMLDMNLDAWDLTCVLLSTLAINYIISDGRSNWSYGVLIVGLYVCIAVAAWFYPANSSVPS